MDIKSRVFEIQKLISINKFSQAILDCEKLIKKFPENSYFHNLCGLALQESDQTLKSIKYFEKALVFESTNFAAMNNLAQVDYNVATRVSDYVAEIVKWSYIHDQPWIAQYAIEGLQTLDTFGSLLISIVVWIVHHTL